MSVKTAPVCRGRGYPGSRNGTLLLPENLYLSSYEPNFVKKHSGKNRTSRNLKGFPRDSSPSVLVHNPDPLLFRAILNFMCFLQAMGS